MDIVGCEFFRCPRERSKNAPASLAGASLATEIEEQSEVRRRRAISTLVGKAARLSAVESGGVA